MRVQSGSRRRGAAIAASLAVASLAAGCGSGEASGPTRADFVKRADAVCRRTDARQSAAKRAFWEGHPGVLGTRQFREEEVGWRTDVVETSVLPQVGEEARELGRLPAPSGDARRVAAIVTSLEEAVRAGERNPTALIGKDAVGPFADAEKLARAYGLRACASPL